MNWLVVITYLAGSVWGPTVQITPMPSQAACAVMQTATAEQIVKASKTNMNGGGGKLSQDNGDSVIASNMGRQIARISCKSGFDSTKNSKGSAKSDVADALQSAFTKE